MFSFREFGSFYHLSDLGFNTTKGRPDEKEIRRARMRNHRNKAQKRKRR